MLYYLLKKLSLESKFGTKIGNPGTKKGELSKMSCIKGIKIHLKLVGLKIIIIFLHILHG